MYRQNTSLELYIWYKSGVQCRFWGCQGSSKEVLYLFGVAWTCIGCFILKIVVRLVDSKIGILKCSFVLTMMWFLLTSLMLHNVSEYGFTMCKF